MESCTNSISMITLTDESLMPFGEHKDKKMANVPAEYLLWLHEKGSTGARIYGVLDYVDDNLEVLRQEIK